MFYFFYDKLVKLYERIGKPKERLDKQEAYMGKRGRIIYLTTLKRRKKLGKERKA